MVGEEPKRPSWVEEHWPWYARNHDSSDASALGLWAQTINNISDGCRLLLSTLCALEEKHGSIRASIPCLARASGSSVNATRARIDKLLKAEAILVRPWLITCGNQRLPRGYEFCLLVDEDRAEAARHVGFRPSRKVIRGLQPTVVAR